MVSVHTYSHTNSYFQNSPCYESIWLLPFVPSPLCSGFSNPAPLSVIPWTYILRAQELSTHNQILLDVQEVNKGNQNKIIFYKWRWDSESLYHSLINLILVPVVSALANLVTVLTRLLLCMHLIVVGKTNTWPASHSLPHMVQRLCNSLNVSSSF